MRNVPSIPPPRFRRGDWVTWKTEQVGRRYGRFLAFSQGSGGAWVKLPDYRGLAGGRTWVALDDLERKVFGPRRASRPA